MYVIYSWHNFKVVRNFFFYEQIHHHKILTKLLWISYWSQELDIGNVNGPKTCMDMVPKFNIPLHHNMTLLSQKKTRYWCVMDSIGLCNNKTSFGHNKRLNVYKTLIILLLIIILILFPLKLVVLKLKKVARCNNTTPS
jgi:hypothetical protein